MKKPGLIIALTLLAVGGATAIYFVLKGDKKKPTLDPNTLPPVPTTRPAQIPGPSWAPPGTPTQPGSTTTPTITPVAVFDPKTFANSKPYKDLKENLRLAYYSMELVCNPTGSNAPVNCKTNKALDPGLAQGVWMQYVRAGKRFANEFNNDPIAIKNADFIAWGNNEIAKFTNKIDVLFPPKFFNTNQPFYADYIAKGGTPIPGTV
jgi:hypothetical protein